MTTEHHHGRDFGDAAPIIRKPGGAPAPRRAAAPGSGRVIVAGEAPRLTVREIAVLDLAGQGLRDREIAGALGIAPGTVKQHLTHVYAKLRVNGRSQALSLLRRLGLDPWVNQEPESDWSPWFRAGAQIERRRRGEVLFRRAEHGERVYLLDHGSIELVDIGAVAQPGTLLGEIAALAPARVRTHTARCLVDVEMRYLTAEQLRRCYFARPDFGFRLLRLITQRLLADRERTGDGRIALADRSGHEPYGASTKVMQVRRDETRGAHDHHPTACTRESAHADGGGAFRKCK